MISLTIGPAEDWFSWSVSLIGALAWPLAALVIALVFRRPLLTLLARLDEPEHFPTNLGHRDGAELGSGRGARKEQCGCIVTDEQRCSGPNSARRAAVAGGSPLDSVAMLAGATSPCRAPRLASGLPPAITMIQIGRKVL